MRVIFQGRPLEWDSTPGTTANLADHSCVHVVITSDTTAPPCAAPTGYRLWNDRRNDATTPAILGRCSVSSQDSASIILVYGSSVLILLYLWNWKLNFPRHFNFFSSFLLTALSTLVTFIIIRRVAAFFRRNKSATPHCGTSHVSTSFPPSDAVSGSRTHSAS